MADNGVIFMLLCGIAAIQDLNAESINHGSWYDAIGSCRRESLLVGYPLRLEQQKLLQNKSFWVPKAFFKTQWIEHLGCSSAKSATSISYNNLKIGQCQHQCIMNYASYFSYKEGTCECQLELPALISESTEVCKYRIFRTISNLNRTGDGDCIKTSCVYTPDSQFVVVSCKEDYSIRGICNDGWSHDETGNHIDHQTAFEKCINRSKHLPGSNDSACFNIKQKGKGWEASDFWSSIFRTSYSMEGIADLGNTRPINCVYGKVTANGTILEIRGNCSEDLPYMCKDAYATTSITNSYVSRDDHAENKNTPLGVVFGVLVASVLVITLLIAVVVIARKRNLIECWKFCKDNNQKVVSNINALNPTSGQPVMAQKRKEIKHITGAITHDEYAVITKTMIQRRDLHHTNNSGLLYSAPYGDYDRFNNCGEHKTQATHAQYDMANNNLLNGGYNVTVHHTRSEGTEDMYHHI